MLEIIPSIIASDFSEIKEKLELLEGLVSWAELDVMDGVFVPNVSWQSEGDLKEIFGKTKLSAHLMVEHPEALVEDWQGLVDRIVLHYEATDNLEEIIERFDRGHNPCELGLALELETSLEKIVPFLEKVKIFQLMSIANIGYQGEKFDERVLLKVKKLREMAPNAKIIVDGGINPEIANRLNEIGVGAAVVGSYIWQSGNIKEAIKDFSHTQSVICA